MLELGPDGDDVIGDVSVDDGVLGVDEVVGEFEYDGEGP